ncbi:hypothetical protein EV421DRAFT_2038791 [Armillaria borealis]|uniref:DUF6699 domain-containing protein n=1 Tax=Armillaria borealis TaxID=47425 RepID=A0AA39J510_9AGAR|nr:hypothetical protein EV421DRAFT_2038791 [Armillaria borealis]
MPSSPSAFVKLRHCYIPLPSRTERDTPTMIHPLLRPASQGEMTMELNFAHSHSLSSIRVLGHKCCVNGAATSPLLPSLAIVHPMLPSPVVIQTSGDREWVIVADVVETIWHALHIFDAMTSSPVVSFLENQDDATLTSCRSTSDWVER